MIKYNVLFLIFLIFYLFSWEREVKRERIEGRETEEGDFPLSREPDARLNPRKPEPWPEPKADSSPPTEPPGPLSCFSS